MADEKLQLERKKKERYLALRENRKHKEAEELWHRLRQGTYIGDFVYGANDGIVTAFAVVSAAAGAALSPGVVIILGFANLLADGFSMGASNFLSLRSGKEFVRMQRGKEEWEVENFPEIEKEEIRDILRTWSVPRQYIEPSTAAIVRDKKRWVDLMMREELHIIEEDAANPIKHAMATFLAFLAAGAVPLVPYLFAFSPYIQFELATFFAAIAFFAVGASRTLVTGANPWRAGLEILLVGGFAATVAYGAGWGVKTLFGIAI